MGDVVAPRLDWVFTLDVRVAAPIDLGEAAGIRRRVIPILAGAIEGPRFRGSVMEGGADWQRIRASDGLARLVATYAIRHEDGAIVQVENRAVRRGPPDAMRRLAAGEPVDPALVYFRCTPSFDAPEGPHAWLNDSIFLASGRRMPDRVAIDFFEVL